MATIYDTEFPHDFGSYSRRDDYEMNDAMGGGAEDNMVMDMDNDVFISRNDMFHNDGVNSAVLMIDPCEDEASFERELLAAAAGSSSNATSSFSSLGNTNDFDAVFKSSSPYTTSHQHNPMKTIVPSELLIKSPEEKYYGGAFGNRFGSVRFGEPMDNSDLRFYIDPHHQDQGADQGLLENPEDEDEEEDEDDEDDDFEFDDEDLYSPDLNESNSSYVDDEWVPSVESVKSGNEPSNKSAIKQEKQLDNTERQPTFDFTDTNSSDNSSKSSSPASSHSSYKGPGRKKIALVGPHRCEIVNRASGQPCNKVFSRPYDLIRHQDTIHAPFRKTFKCEYCGTESKTFSRMDALSRHIRVKHS